jgi:hypothetical protein
MSDKIFDFQEKRKANIEKKKRAFERIILKDFLGAYAEIDEAGTKYPVKIIDISYDGWQIQIPYTKNAQKHFKVGSEVCIRLYFTADDFIPVIASTRHENIQNDARGELCLRYGCEFDKSHKSYEALKPFIEFLYKFAEHSCQDKGEHKVYFL